MFRHVLIPTDGSLFSDTTVRRGVELAGEMNARVTGLHVIAPFDFTVPAGKSSQEARSAYERSARAHGRKVLASLRKAAKLAGATVSGTVVAISEQPHEAILDTAREAGCDLILMASHGRRGLDALVLGSETHKVLVHSKIPVLVYR